jgi:hypothetical protein
MRRVQRVSPLPNRAFDKSQLRQPDLAETAREHAPFAPCARSISLAGPACGWDARLLNRWFEYPNLEIALRARVDALRTNPSLAPQ